MLRREEERMKEKGGREGSVACILLPILGIF